MTEATSWRLATGGRINRTEPVMFRFNGDSYRGFTGDTLASALLANGVRCVGRSFKYHRPRGILTAGIEEPNAIVQLCGTEDEPNVPATVLQLRAGLEARSVNCWPSVRFDVAAVNDYLHALFPAGFYYKTFLWPVGGWNFYGNIIRRAAGLGLAPRAFDVRDRYEKRYHHCDVLIVGAGSAGLAAALTAGRSGARVMLVDEQCEAGGQLLNFDGTSGEIARQWLGTTLAELSRLPNVVHLQRAAAVGYYDHNMVYVAEQLAFADATKERLWRVRAQRVLLATGALERPLVFGDNDRPGIMLASAAASYVQRYAVRPGNQAVFVTNNDSAYDSAFTLARAGVRVAAIVDVRGDVCSRRKEIARDLAIEVLPRHTVRRVFGRKQVSGLAIAPIREPERLRTISCDLLGTSGGWNPTVHLHAQSGARPRYSAQLAAFVPGQSVQQERSIGAAAGEVGIAGCIRQGSIAGARAVAELGFEPGPATPDPPFEPWTYSIEPAWALPGAASSSRAFVDFGHDVTAADIKLALAENYESVELVKRYTTSGMAIDQGKLGSANTIGVIASLKGCDPGTIGTTTFRPLYRPVSFGALAGQDKGELTVPARRTPLTGWFESVNAQFSEAGEGFRRPFRIPRAGESAQAAVQREALAVRQAAGIYDGSPLGKFELYGRDVVTFLNRLYTNRWDNLPIGMGRFGWMLHEDGRLFDDGVTFRPEDQRYWMTTGSSATSAVHAHLERLLQCEWPDLRVFVTPVTEEWANVCLCGPRAREILGALGTDIDISRSAFPFMGIRTGTVAGLPARIARVSYTGELSFEINVRARDGLVLWKALLSAGAPFGLTPVGSDAILLLRLEKGFIAAWAEGDGYVTPHDAGLDWNVNYSKGDFIGRRSLLRDRAIRGPRPQIVGLLPVEREFVPTDGAPLVDETAGDEGSRVIGHVTAGGYSPNLGRSIALAQLMNGREQLGKEVTIYLNGRPRRALVTQPIFLDPSGERLRS